MRITHKISVSAGIEPTEAFKKWGIQLTPFSSGETQFGFAIFNIDEDDPRWPAVSSLVEKFGALDTISTKFSQVELNHAPYLEVIPSWHHGYPQPESDFGYLRATYDLSAYCSVCGAGQRQIAPFRLRNAPTWGTRLIFQLNWVFDEYFVEPGAWSSIFKPFGIQGRPVLLRKTEAVLDSVVQLDITQLGDLDLHGYKFTTCPHCARKKYLPIVRGLLPNAQSPIKATCYKSNQWFGSGGSANKAVFVSNELYKAMKAAKLKGVTFNACRS
jgi:hypothetical protein